MPGSIRLTVLDAFDITEAAGGDGVFIRASMGKKQFTTRVAETMGGKAGPWDDEHAFSVLSLTDHLIISLLTASGKSLGSTQVTTPSIVEKGFRDEVLGMKDGKGHVVGQVHVKLSFVLSDEERKKIEAMRAKSLAKKGEGQNASDAPVAAPSDSVGSPSLNGKRSTSSKFSFNKAIGNGQSLGEADAAAVMAELSQEVNAEVAKASTAAFQATADVAKQAQEAAASGPQEVASRASQTAQKATRVSEKAAGIAATAAEQAASSAGVGNGLGQWDEDTPPSVGEEVLLRRPSVKERVAALESPPGGSSLGDGAQDDDGEDARLAQEDWQRAEAVEEALRAAEQRKREEDSKKVGKAAAEAKRYEQEYLEQKQREEERKRKEAEKKKEQERRRAAKAAAEAREEAERRAEEEQRRAEREEGGEEEAEEGAFSKVWQQVGGTLAFVVALFVLWPRDSRKRVASKRRVKLSGDTYVVKKGDTLDNIVGRMCYNPNSEFYKLNPEVCDRNTIYPGQVLRVPEYQ